jgi:hypothetical protein
MAFMNLPTPNLLIFFSPLPLITVIDRTAEGVPYLGIQHKKGFALSLWRVSSLKTESKIAKKIIPF